MKKGIAALVLFLPTLLLGFYVFTAMAELDKAPTLRVPVGGYDPVDILHGRYVRVRFSTQELMNHSQEIKIADPCLCFTKLEPPLPNGQNVRAHRTTCAQEALKQCDFSTRNTRFFQWESHKYFVDERYAPVLEKLIREATPTWRDRRERHKNNEPEPPSRVTMDVAVSSSGALRLKQLYIDNKPWKESLPKAP